VGPNGYDPSVRAGKRFSVWCGYEQSGFLWVFVFHYDITCGGGDGEDGDVASMRKGLER
jgi:hypothetical protein